LVITEEDKKIKIKELSLVSVEELERYGCHMVPILEAGLLWLYINIYNAHMKTTSIGNCP